MIFGMWRRLESWYYAWIFELPEEGFIGRGIVWFGWEEDLYLAAGEKGLFVEGKVVLNLEMKKGYWGVIFDNFMDIEIENFYWWWTWMGKR